MSQTSVGAEGRGYNRGLILGFTMAESLLLVVFCLLLVTAAIITKERQRASVAEQRAREAVEIVTLRDHELGNLKAQAEAMRALLAASGGERTEEEWRELVLAKTTIDKLAAELSVASSAEVAERIASMVDEHRTLVKAVSDQEALMQELEAARAELAQLRALADQQAQRLAESGNPPKPHEWPPIITLSEANNNYFRSGSAELTPTFSEKLNSSISEEIARNLQAYGADIVEVIGHTDEQPLSRAGSNMDKNAIDVIWSKKGVVSMEPADNAGLGLARAISVANVLKSNQSLSAVTVLPLSAAQLILPGDTLTHGEAGAVETRRRIEIRIRRRDAGSP